MKDFLLAIIDWFYPPFRKVMPLQTFRYAACGGSNTLLDISLYALCYNYILHRNNVDLGSVVISPYIASFIFSFCISFPTGFFLMRYLVFTESNLHKRVQLFRYFVLVVVCLGLNYIFIKFFVERCHIYPTPAKVLTTFIVVGFSYLTQKHFTFRVKQEKTGATTTN